MKKIYLLSLILILFFNITVAQTKTFKVYINIKGFDKKKQYKAEIFTINEITRKFEVLYNSFLDKPTTYINYSYKEEHNASMIISVNGKNEGGGRFVCTNEIIKFSFNDIEKKTEITGGENKYFQDNMFLLFSIPTKVTIDNDYKNNYAKEYYDLKQHNFSVLLYKYLEYENNILQTVKQNKTKFTVLTHLWDNRDYISTKTLDSCYRMLSVAFPKNTLTTLLYEYIKKGKKIYIGSKLPKFGVNNLNNELIKSDSFYKRNTYTLIHFWATWCKPCIEESKKIDSFINKYTIKDLSVIYISLDTNKSLWKKYLNEKKVTGEHFIDEKGFSSNVAKIFNLSYIPFNVLIDSTNRIVDLKYDEVKIKTLLSK